MSRACGDECCCWSMHGMLVVAGSLIRRSRGTGAGPGRCRLVECKICRWKDALAAWRRFISVVYLVWAKASSGISLSWVGKWKHSTCSENELVAFTYDRERYSRNVCCCREGRTGMRTVPHERLGAGWQPEAVRSSENDSVSPSRVAAFISASARSSQYMLRYRKVTGCDARYMRAQ